MEINNFEMYLLPLNTPNNNFATWANTYNIYLFELYEILNKFKTIEKLNITKDDFAKFVYNNSSKYITDY